MTSTGLSPCSGLRSTAALSGQGEELSRATALTSASVQMKNEFARVAQYAVGQMRIIR